MNGSVPIVCAVVAGAVLLSTVGRAQDQSVPPLGAPGKLVDVGGWRLHLHCTGNPAPRQPTVILEAGVGNFSVEWSLVQPQVSQFARVCSYDRAGHGWSELGPHPRTMRQVVYELGTLLDRGGEKPPYVLVGQSYGAWLVRLFATTYPRQVAGLVLVDGGFDNPWRLTRDGLVRASELERKRRIPERRTSEPLRETEVPPPALAQMKAAAQAAGPRANEPPRDKLPSDAQRMRTWALARWEHYAAAANPFELEELAALRVDRLARNEMFGEMPLVVLSRGIPDGSAVDERERTREHAQLAAMSRNGRHLVAGNSGHHIHLDQPNLVVQTIHDVVIAVRHAGR